jgi:hypothetical protein
MTHARPGRRCPRPLREVSGRARISGGYVAFAQRQSGDTQATAVHHQDGVSRRLIPFTPAAASRRGCRKEGSEKLWNLTGGRRIGIRRSDEVLVPHVGHLRPPRAWVVPSQIDAPDLWVVCATASDRCGCIHGPDTRRVVRPAQPRSVVRVRVPERDLALDAPCGASEQPR